MPGNRFPTRVVEGMRRPWFGDPWISRLHRLDRSPLENDRESPLSSAHVVPIYLVGLRRSLVRNFKHFIDLFDEIFILEVDAETLNERLDSRPDDDWGKCNERELILRLHATKEGVPSNGIVIDATQPLVSVVDEILSYVRIPKVKNSN
jgi:hypothetical protein